MSPGRAGRKTVVLEVQEPRRALGEHLEAFAKLRRAVELEHVVAAIRPFSMPMSTAAQPPGRALER